MTSEDDAEALRLVAACEAKLRRTLAEQRYRRIGDASQLLALGINHATVKRGRGSPAKTMFNDEQIVQLVWKQKFQAGLPFTNGDGRENNLCFQAVADAQGLSVHGVIKRWNSVPAERRKFIGEWVRERLRNGGALDSRHRLKN